MWRVVITSQRTECRMPHAHSCRLLGVSESWYYKWAARARVGALTAGETRRRELDAAVRQAFERSRGLHGSPRLHADLRDLGWVVSRKTVAASMRRQGLVARRIRRRHGLTRPGNGRAPFPDLLKRDFTAPAANVRWVGDVTEIPVSEHERLCLATVIDLYSRRLLAAVIGQHADARLVCRAIRAAVNARGGVRCTAGVIFHSDHGSIYTSDQFTILCRTLKITQSMGRVGSCFDCEKRKRSSLPWNGRCCPAPSSVTRVTPKPWSWSGATGSTTTAAVIPTTNNAHRYNTRSRPPNENPPRSGVNHTRPTAGGTGDDPDPWNSNRGAARDRGRHATRMRTCAGQRRAGAQVAAGRADHTPLADQARTGLPHTGDRDRLLST